METYSKGYDSEQDVANHSSEGGADGARESSSMG